MAKSARVSSGGSSAARRDNRDVAGIVGAVVILALLIAFVLDNSNTVRVGFVFFHADVSLIWVLLIAAFLGGVIDRLVIMLRRRRKARPSPNG
jgi:uncharacterized integral membrane protein